VSHRAVHRRTRDRRRAEAEFETICGPSSSEKAEMTDPRHPTPGHSQFPQQHPTSVTSPPQQRPQPVIPHGAPAPQLRPGITPMPVQPIRPTEADLDPIELVDDGLEEITATPSSPMGPVGTAAPMAPPVKSKIKQFGAEFAKKEHQWKRTPHRDGKGAIRVKTFHGKYSDQGMEHLDDVINEWLDNHPEVEVKFVTSTVNVFEGKIREPALVLNVWY
jgi:hypothetical protein